MATLLEGKVRAVGIKESLKKEVEELKAKYGKGPKLASVQAGENAGADAYVRAQTKVAEALGIEYSLHKLSGDISSKEFEKFIGDLNNDESVTGIIVQMPLPSQIDAKKMPLYISPEKDVEGMHPANLGKIVSGKGKIGPCTAMAVMELIAASGVELRGKEAVVVGHSEIVGKPVALMLLDKFATTTVCHIGTGERGLLEEHIGRAEVLVAAVGKAGIVKGEWIKEGAVVVDVGINRIDGKIVGDVEFDKAEQRAAFITPVPGGVGPLTVTILMRNVAELFKNVIEG